MIVLLLKQVKDVSMPAPQLRVLLYHVCSRSSCLFRRQCARPPIFMPPQPGRRMIYIPKIIRSAPDLPSTLQ